MPEIEGANRAAKPFARWVWIPLLFTACGLILLVVFAGSPRLARIGDVCGLLYFAGLLYFLVQLIGRLALRQWRPAAWAAGRLVLCAAAFIPAAALVFVAVVFGPSDDHFADNLTIPADIAVSDPLPKPESVLGSSDTFGKSLVDTLRVPASTDASIRPAMPSLRTLAQDHRLLMMRYLASSAAWRVFEERGSLFATRRWCVNGAWLWDLHGYYSLHDIEDFPPADRSDFQSRTTIGLNGKPWAGRATGATWLDEGETPVQLKLSKGNQVDESHAIIRCGAVVVELFEQSPGAERRLTKAALAALDTEFKAWLDKKAFDPSLLPIGSIRRGKPTLDLCDGMQPGIYEVYAWANPGEAGCVYLKAFEVTHGTALSAERLREKSNEHIGWSNDPEELFLSNTNIRIYEGGWGKPYAARMELWFVPDSGAPERKLAERVFKIEGWQR